MGDRYGIGIVQYKDDEPKGILWFYSHSGFDGGPSRLIAKALSAASSRWDDQDYSNRIIISNFMQNVYGNAGVGSEYGSGISFDSIAGCDHKLFVIDCVEKKVVLFPNWEGDWASKPKAIVVREFEPFISKFLK